MKVSYNWLQTYFKEKLPTPEKLADIFTFHAFEVDGIEYIYKKEDAKNILDTILDVKVLPDRACYALSHRGIAREIAYNTILTLDQTRITVPNLSIPESKILELDILTTKEQNTKNICRRTSKLVIRNIDNHISPQWLKEKLEVLGQRSISFIVDVTNYVMLDMGQPLHAFDLDKLTQQEGTYKLGLRPSKQGEKITILGGKEYELPEGILMFTDEHNIHNNLSLPLDIAGIKGGIVAEVTPETKNIILLADNFLPAYIRKASTQLGIRTDAVKRFENNITPELTMDGLLHAAEIIMQESKTAEIEGIVASHTYVQEPTSITITSEYISNMLGVTLTSLDIEPLLSRLEIPYKRDNQTFILTIPPYRLDLKIPQDIVEEIGRVYGYENIPATLLPDISSQFKPKVVKSFYYQNKIKDVLVNLGFSEIYTYVFQPQGDIELEKPLASDKKYLRADLSHGVAQSLELNTHNADLLGLDTIKLFEIGNVFTKNKDQSSHEHASLCIAVKNIKKSKIKEFSVIAEAIQKISEGVSVKISADIKENINIVELDLSSIIKNLPEPTEYQAYELLDKNIKYKPFSVYPFAVRDIAVFTPEGSQEETEKIIRDIIETHARELLVRNTLFDVFTKKDQEGNSKTSYAFRMVFQSHERTLTEQEINGIMSKITTAMNSNQGWQVR